MPSFDAVLVPALIALLGLFPLAALPARWMAARAWSALAALIVASAYVVGHALVFPGWWTFPPNDALHWTLYLAAGAGVLAAFAEFLPTLAGLFLRLLACLAVPALVLSRSLRDQYAAPAAGILIADVGWLAFAALAAHAFVQRRLGHVGTFNLGLTAACAAVACGLTGSAKLAQLAGSLAIALGALWIAVVLVARRGDAGRRLARAVAPAAALPAAVTLTSLLLCATFYGDTPVPCVLHIAAGPLIGALAAAAPLGPAPHKQRARRTVLCAGLALLPLAAAIALAVASFNSSDEDVAQAPGLRIVARAAAHAMLRPGPPAPPP